jgi:5-methylcytosine-specific restriction endonuclease McrA
MDVGARATKRLLTLDHIIAIWAGGAEDDLDNMQLLCRVCHRIKRLGEDLVREKKMMMEASFS